MLKGTKPLAAFLYSEGENEDVNLGGQPFKKHVKKGRLVRHDLRFTNQGVNVHMVLFALPGQEWRFEAFELMRQLFEKEGWNDTLERMEGTLLGYEDWQNDWHMANRDHYRLHGD
ncbi:MAG TPA: hypothetical protein VG839_01015 [Asticcacaulis sp.]|nr:hypothetical protein [Asticcacaulis sp.]